MFVLQSASFIKFDAKRLAVDCFDHWRPPNELQMSPAFVRYSINAYLLGAAERNPHKRSCRVMGSKIDHYLKFWFPAIRGARKEQLAETAATVNAEATYPEARVELVAYKGYRGLIVVSI